MNELWSSPDRYVLVAEVEMPDDEGQGANELAPLFQMGAWVVVWRSTGLWHVTRNRRYGKPNLQQLRSRNGGGILRTDWLIFPSGEAGRQLAEIEVDPIAVGQAIYAAWAVLAYEALPAKLAFLGHDPDDFDELAVSAWMRPGIPLYRAWRAEWRELVEG